MTRRIFLLALMTAWILLLGLVRAATQATPFSGGSTWGGFTFWELRHSLTTGIFSAGIIYLTAGAFFQTAQSAAQLAGRKPAHSGQLTAACLWCGIPIIFCCAPARHLIISHSGVEFTCIALCAAVLIIGHACRNASRVTAWGFLSATLLCLLFLSRELIHSMLQQTDSGTLCICGMTLLGFLPILALKLCSRKTELQKKGRTP